MMAWDSLSCRCARRARIAAGVMFRKSNTIFGNVEAYASSMSPRSLSARTGQYSGALFVVARFCRRINDAVQPAGAYLEIARMKPKMVLDKTGDEEIAVVVAFLQPQFKRDIVPNT